MTIPKVTEILREKDLMKASAIYEIPFDILKRMNDQCLLNVQLVKAEVIRQDYLNLKKYVRKNAGRKWYGEKELLVSLSKEYSLHVNLIRDIVNRNNGKMTFCKVCGKRISHAMYNRTGGLCQVCNADSLPRF